MSHRDLCQRTRTRSLRLRCCGALTGYWPSNTRRIFLSNASLVNGFSRSITCGSGIPCRAERGAFEACPGKVLACLRLRQYGIEKSWQIPLEIDPARIAHADDAVWAETGLCGSYRQSDENISWMRTFFSAGVPAVHSRAHTAFLLHLSWSFFSRFSRMREPHLSAGRQLSRFASRTEIAKDFY